MVVSIPRRLEEPARIYVFEPDELLALLAPIVIGMTAKNPLAGIALGIGGYVVWTRIKGVLGFYGLHALRYWTLPKSVSRLRALAPSAVRWWVA